jgi:hypothetical protein
MLEQAMDSSNGLADIGVCDKLNFSTHLPPKYPDVLTRISEGDPI